MGKEELLNALVAFQVKGSSEAETRAQFAVLHDGKRVRKNFHEQKDEDSDQCS